MDSTMTRVVRSSREEKRRERERRTRRWKRCARRREPSSSSSFVRSFARRYDHRPNGDADGRRRLVSPLDIDLMANACLSYGWRRSPSPYSIRVKAICVLYMSSTVDHASIHGNRIGIRPIPRHRSMRDRAPHLWRVLVSRER